MEKDHLDIAARLRGIGISGSYASELARGVRQPSIDKALEIYSKTGLQLGPLKSKTPKQIAAVKRASELLSGAA